MLAWSTFSNEPTAQELRQFLTLDTDVEVDVHEESVKSLYEAAEADDSPSSNSSSSSSSKKKSKKKSKKDKKDKNKEMHFTCSAILLAWLISRILIQCHWHRKDKKEKDASPKRKGNKDKKGKRKPGKKLKKAPLRHVLQPQGVVQS